MTSQLLINEPPLQVLPTLARIIGLNEAIVLQQIHYWLHPQTNRNYFDGRHWVYNTYEQWQKQFPFFSQRTLRRTVKNLETGKLLLSCKGGDLNQTKFYTINYNFLADICLNPQKEILEETSQQSCLNHPAKLDTPSGQTGQTIRPNWTPQLAKMATPSGQIGHLTYTETTPENTTENIPPPPLTPPPQFAARAPEEEEEEEIYFESENLNWNSEPDQTLPGVDLTINEEEVMQEQKTQELDLYSELVVLWNQIVQSKLSAGSEACLTNKRKALLNKFLQEVLHNTTRTEKIDAWQNYCTLIAKTQFLMGNNSNGFKVTFDWALVPDNAFKVLEGAYYDKPSLSKSKLDSSPWEEFSEELVRTLPSSKHLTQWVKMSIIIAKFIGQEKYKAWFTKVALSEVTETKAIFLVERQITKDSIIRYFSSEIRCAVQSLYPNVNQVEFKVVPSLGDQA